MDILKKITYALIFILFGIGFIGRISEFVSISCYLLATWLIVGNTIQYFVMEKMMTDPDLDCNTNGSFKIYPLSKMSGVVILTYFYCGIAVSINAYILYRIYAFTGN